MTVTAQGVNEQGCVGFFSRRTPEHQQFILRLVAGNYEKGEALFPSLMALIDAHHSASRPLFKHVQRAEFPYLALSLLRVMLTWGRGTPPEEKLIKVPPALLLRLFDTMASVRRDMFMDLLAVTGREWFVVIPDDRFDDILCKVHRPLLFRYPFSDAMLKTFQYVPLFPMTGVQDKLIAIRNKVFPGAEFPISIYWKSEVYKMIMKAHRSSMFTVRILLFAFLEDVGDDRIQIHFLRFFGDFNAWLMEEERNEEKFREQMSKIFPEHPHEALFSDCRDLTIVYSVIANNALPRNAFLSM